MRFLLLTLRGRDGRNLIEDEEDWQALSVMAERMLFWCGGAIHGCRCRANSLHFAIELAQAPIAQVVRHLSGGYAMHLRRRYGWSGKIFRRYRSIPVDVDLYWDDLIVWLHQPRQRDCFADIRAHPCWTADAAYRTPGALPWVSTKLVLEMLGGSGLTEYRRRMTQAVAPQVVALCDPPIRARRGHAASASTLNHLDVQRIVELVAARSGVSYEDMASGSRRRRLAKAKAVATVLSVRHGASAALMARLFKRSPSTLSESVEYYRQTQPSIYINAEMTLAGGLANCSPLASKD